MLKNINEMAVPKYYEFTTQTDTEAKEGENEHSEKKILE